MSNKSILVDLHHSYWWSKPLEYLLLTFSSIGVISSILFVFIVLSREKLRRNLSLLLAINLNLGGFIACTSMLSQGVRMLMNWEEDYFCPYRSYLFTFGGLYIFQSALLQTFHRLLLTVFVHRREWQNKSYFFFIALFQMTFCLLALSPLLFYKKFPYFTSSKACYIAFDDIVGIFYPATIFYFAPLTLQSICSLWILRHLSRRKELIRPRSRSARKMEKRLLKEKRVLARLALPVVLLLSVGFIYFTFVLVKLFRGPQWNVPPYALHCSFLGSSLATGLAMLANLFLHRSVKKTISLSLSQRKSDQSYSVAQS